MTKTRDSAVPDDGPSRHVPVLLDEVLQSIAPRRGGLYVDATFGAGGYARAILATADTRVIGIDRDRAAITSGADLARRAAGRLVLVEDLFSNLAEVCAAQGAKAVDGIVMDVGVSSMQLDTAERGFSFRLDGPLDMRMGMDGPSAADVVARASEADLARVLFVLGEERFSRQIARAIVGARARSPIATTKALADIVSGVVRSRPADIHPATRTFQALRILVNDELEELSAALSAAERVLKPGGRLVVVTFHSLEDRIVKAFLADRSRTPAVSRHQPERPHVVPSFRILNPRPKVAGSDELARNPRARSAKLRAAERTSAPPHRERDSAKTFPTLAEVMG